MKSNDTRRSIARRTLAFGAKTARSAALRAQIAGALLDGVTRTDAGSHWSQGLLSATDAGRGAISSFLMEMQTAGHCKVVRVAAGRTPIGGGWGAHSDVELTEAGRAYLAIELVGFESARTPAQSALPTPSDDGNSDAG